MMRRSMLWASLPLLAALALASGCDALVMEQPAWGADVSRPVLRPFRTPERITEPQVTDAEQKKRLDDTNKLLDDFGKRAQVAFTTDEAAKHLAGLESFYMSTGRYLELVDLYRQAYDLHGPTHYIGPRLAWAYLTIGEEGKAKEITDEALLKRPNDPFAHFVHGYLIGADASNDPAVGLQVYRAWARTVELDPAFVGPQGITAARIKGRLVEMKKMLEQQGVQPDAPPEPPKTPGDAPAADAPKDAPAAEAPKDAPPAATPADANAEDVRLVQAESLLAEGKYNEAGRLFDDVLKDDPLSRRADVGRAVAAWSSDTVQRRNAEQMLRHVTLRKDLDGRQLYELGVVFLREVKDKDKALELWRRAESADPDFARTVRLRQTIERVEKP